MPSKALLRPADVLAEARRIPGVPVGAERRARPAGDPRPPRRGDPRPRRLGPAALAGRTRDRPLPRRRALRRRAPAARRRRRPDARARRWSSPPAAAPRCRRSTASTRSQPGTTARATTAKRVPESMIVLGGGPVGSELSQAWASLGTKVTLVEGDEHLLSREEPFAGEEVADVAARELRRRRPHRRPGREGRGRRRRGRSPSSSDGEPVEGEEILVAVGRVPTPPSSPSTRPGSSPTSTASSRPTTACGSAAASGSTRSATSTAAPSSPTWASTRPGSRPRTCSAATVEAVAEGHRLAARHLHRPAGGRGRQDARRRRARPGIDARAVDVPTDGSRRRQLPGQGHRRHLAPRRRPGARDDRRRHLHRLRDRRLPPGRHGRDRRRGAAGPPAPRGRRPTPPAARSG